MISIAIPTYESKGRAEEFARFQFRAFTKQTYKNFEVVISDHSKDDVIKNVCEEYQNRLNIKYIRNEQSRGFFSYNINNAMKHCSGDIIKFLCFDDFLWNKNSLQYIYEAFEKDINWVVSALEHTKDDGKTFYRAYYCHYTGEQFQNNNQIPPRFLGDHRGLMHLGNNTFSGPSCLAIRNTNDKIYFDDRLIWLMDCDYYKRLFDKYGPPKILNKITAVIRDHSEQLTHTMGSQIKQKEYSLMVQKYG